MKFIKTINISETFPKKAYYLIFNNKGDLLVNSENKNENKNEKQLSIPCVDPREMEQLQLKDVCSLGTCEDIPCFCAGFADGSLQNKINLKYLNLKYQWVNLRGVFNQIASDFWEVVGYARGINDCQVNFKFCGKCGRKTEQKTCEHGRFCQSCSLVFYPRISPAIIVAVVKEDRLLLARGINFPNKKMFSVLAGFVEPQERLEDCVKREVFEETGIKVKNVTYFSSQPWPFPDSLMIGFTAEYESGELNPDPKEILEADWFPADQLPLVPGKPTLSGDLIQWFVTAQQKGMLTL